ncbi:ATP-dependent DNA helicase PIF1 like protein [Argiope bruennichi]|uniref:ATP-dependent DNA helicase PIF1 like protein n=1 Tax=Argiope bruennichi TaxID=94029 RepID=A0A8T0EA37_ARGBR|nr:ATP-dependent DNA helicase PIF1 like protein [Argiope bruennichi]
MSESEEDISLLCFLKVCYLDNKGNVSRQISNPKSYLQLGRNEFRDIVLKIECGKIHCSFKIKDMTLHTRFVKEGKSTITLKQPPLQMFISNCPVGKLSMFLKVLMAKVQKAKNATPVSVKDRLQTLKPPSFQDISPLTALDINILNNKVSAAMTKKSAFPQTPKSTKRKREHGMQENTTPTRGQNRTFCFQSAAWRNSIDINIELCMVKRQDDKNFINILQDVRRGRCTRDVIEKLKATNSHRIDKDGIMATKLSTHKDDVDIINNSHLEKLPGHTQTYFATDNYPELSRFISNHSHVLDKIDLKVGAQVMLTKNLDLQRGLVNGARGVVTGFDAGQQKLPIVKFVCGIQQVVNYEKWTVKTPGGLVLVRKMLPLQLAWAMSIHKSQGMTLDCVEVSLGRVFECGQAYVALSRARNLQGLKVLDIEPFSIRADPRVLKFYSELDCMNTYQTEMDDYLDTPSYKDSSLFPPLIVPSYARPSCTTPLCSNAFLFVHSLQYLPPTHPPCSLGHQPHPPKPPPLLIRHNNHERFLH